MRILIISLLFGYLDAILLRSPAIVQLGSKNGISLCKADQRSSNKNRIFMAAVSTANPANAFKGPLLKAFKNPLERLLLLLNTNH